MNDGFTLRAATILAALAHPTRIALVQALREGELSVGALAKQLEMAQPSVSQHLATLQRAGAVVVRPQGTARLYRLRGPRVEQMVSLAMEFCQVHGLQGEGDLDVEP